MAISIAQPQISFTVSLVLSAANSTLENLAANWATAFANIYLTCLNPWLDIAISQAIHTNTWKFAESACIWVTMKLEKRKNKDSFSNSGPWIPTESKNDSQQSLSLLGRRANMANARNVSYTSNPTSEKRTTSTFVDQTRTYTFCVSTSLVKYIFIINI